jgi:uncharacterized protein (TIGR00369 family)
MPPTDDDYSPGAWNERSKGYFPGLIGLEITECGPGMATARLAVHQGLLAPNGYLHAAAVIGLADTLCGYGALANRPEGSLGFTTIETKSNHLGTVREGVISCTARMAHGGRTTQVWDAEVSDEATGKVFALFRCTQLMLYPR